MSAHPIQDQDSQLSPLLNPVPVPVPTGVTGDDLFFDDLQHKADQALIRLGGYRDESGTMMPYDPETAMKFALIAAWPLTRHCERLVSMGVGMLHWEEVEILRCVLNRIGWAMGEAEKSRDAASSGMPVMVVEPKT
jgi:hypothetical protein